MNDQPPQLDNQSSKPDKVKALADYIIAECKKQGFQIHDFKYLQELLEIELANRVYLLELELF